MRFSSEKLYRAIPIALALIVSAAPLGAQGIVDMVVPRDGANSETARYHAKVREQISAMLQRWAQSIERKDSVALAANYTPNSRSVIGREPEASTPLGVVSQMF